MGIPMNVNYDGQFLKFHHKSSCLSVISILEERKTNSGNKHNKYINYAWYIELDADTSSEAMAAKYQKV